MLIIAVEAMKSIAPLHAVGASARTLGSAPGTLLCAGALSRGKLLAAQWYWDWVMVPSADWGVLPAFPCCSLKQKQSLEPCVSAAFQPPQVDPVVSGAEAAPAAQDKAVSPSHPSAGVPVHVSLPGCCQLSDCLLSSHHKTSLC